MVGDQLTEMSCTVLTLFSLTRPPYRPTSLVFDELRHKDSHDPPSRRCESESSSDSSESFPTTPIEAYTTLQNLFLYHGVESREDEMPNTIVYIDILHPDHSINVDSSLKSSGQVAEEHSWVERGYKIIRATQYPRHLCDIDPTITLLSHSMTNARSYFTVYSEDRLIFSESTILEVVDSASDVDGVLYKTSLVPGLWDLISQSTGMTIKLLASVLLYEYVVTDASQYTIIQRVIQDSSSSSSKSPTIFYSLYKFVYQTSSSTEPNAFISPMLAPESVVQNSDLSFETMLSLEADTYPDMVDFAKSPDIFDLDFALAPAKWSQQCSQAQSVVSSPIHYPQSMSNIILDVDEQLLSPASSFDETDIANYVSDYIHCFLN